MWAVYGDFNLAWNCLLASVRCVYVYGVILLFDGDGEKRFQPCKNSVLSLTVSSVSSAFAVNKYTQRCFLFHAAPCEMILLKRQHLWAVI